LDFDAIIDEMAFSAMQGVAVWCANSKILVAS